MLAFLCPRVEGLTYAVFLQVVRQVSNHDLGLGGNTVLGRTALLALAGSGLFVALVSCECLVGGFGESYNLARNIGRGTLGRGSIDELDLLGAFSTVGLLQECQ